MNESDAPAFMANLGRRLFLRLSAGTVASGLIPRLGHASTPSSESDVIVIGAGLAGLTAARALVDQGIDSVRVLEARDRVG